MMRSMSSWKRLSPIRSRIRRASSFRPRRAMQTARLSRASGGRSTPSAAAASKDRRASWNRPARNDARPAANVGDSASSAGASPSSRNAGAGAADVAAIGGPAVPALARARLLQVAPGEHGQHLRQRGDAVGRKARGAPSLARDHDQARAGSAGDRSTAARRPGRASRTCRPWPPGGTRGRARGPRATTRPAHRRPRASAPAGRQSTSGRPTCRCRGRRPRLRIGGGRRSTAAHSGAASGARPPAPRRRSPSAARGRSRPARWAGPAHRRACSISARRRGARQGQQQVQRRGGRVLLETHARQRDLPLRRAVQQHGPAQVARRHRASCPSAARHSPIAWYTRARWPGTPCAPRRRGPRPPRPCVRPSRTRSARTPRSARAPAWRALARTRLRLRTTREPAGPGARPARPWPR